MINFNFKYPLAPWGLIVSNASKVGGLFQGVSNPSGLPVHRKNRAKYRVFLAKFPQNPYSIV